MQEREAHFLQYTSIESTNIDPYLFDYFKSNLKQM